MDRTTDLDHRLRCEECGRVVSGPDLRGWRAYLTRKEVAMYCPACAEREFGPAHE